MTTDRTRRLALTITATVCLLALIATFNNPAAFTVALFGTGWIASVAWALVTRSRLTDSEAECVELARVARVAAEENAELDQENMRLHLELSEAQLLAGTVRVPSLRVVPNGGKVMSADGYRCCGHCADDPVHAVGTDRHEVPCNAPNSQGCIGRTYATDPEVTL